MEMVVVRDRPLADLLARASSDELAPLADLITDNGEGRIALDSGIRSIICKHRGSNTLPAIAELLSLELRRFGGNTVVNVFRSEGIEYMEVASDVARHLGAKLNGGEDVYAVEQVAIDLASKNFQLDGDRGVYDANLAARLFAAIRNAAAESGGAAALAVNGGVGLAGFAASRLASLAAGPAALLSAASSTIYQATGPALRVTVPAVIAVAAIRRRQMESEFRTYTRSLRACL